MAAIDKFARAAIPVFDGASIFGGQLAKAKFVCYPGAAENQTASGEPWELQFFLNPASIKVEKSMRLEQAPTVQTTTPVRYAHTEPLCLELGELWFDTYDTRESVREKYIDDLESLVDYDGETHFPNVVVFVFGEFTQRTDHKTVYQFYLTKLTVEYTMFLPDGTPVRAKVSCCLQQVLSQATQEMNAPKSSPDHARIYTVKQGDTLQRIANFAYGSPTEWRRIADANRIDDPMTLRPGASLLLPPILK